MYSLALLATLASALATPLVARQNATSTSSAPKVTITPAGSNGQGVEITGTTYASFGQDIYAGIPFASPPVGDLRFEPPQTFIYNSTFNAVNQPPACLQNPNGSLVGTEGISEDCLYLNVYAPHGANAQTVFLPVMVWIYGGSFQSGTLSTYNASSLMATGLLTQRPFIFVAINYRLGIFGWPNGPDAAANGAANLGLRDQIAGLTWVQQNIWAWGGDPNQVTVFGQSAGGISISLMYLQPNLNLFQKAIIESGGASVIPLTPTADRFTAGYDEVLKLTNCTGNSTSNSTSAQPNSAAWQCLKALPAEQLLKAQLATQAMIQFSGYVFSPSIDGDLIPDSPHKLISEGKFAQLPFIMGNNKDEGTIFVPEAISSETELFLLLNILEPTGFANTTFAQLLEYYPNDPVVGSPYGTGNDTFGLSPVFKQAASIIGDGTFQASRRWALRNAAKIYPNLQTWSYFFNQSSPGTEAEPEYGKVYYVYGAPQFGLGNYSAEDVVTSKNIQNYWCVQREYADGRINFAVYGDPTSDQSPVSANLTAWPQYGTGNQMLKFESGNTSIIEDNYREENMSFFNQNPTAFNLKRSIHW